MSMEPTRRHACRKLRKPRRSCFLRQMPGGETFCGPLQQAALLQLMNQGGLSSVFVAPEEESRQHALVRGSAPQNRAFLGPIRDQIEWIVKQRTRLVEFTSTMKRECVTLCRQHLNDNDAVCLAVSMNAASSRGTVTSATSWAKIQRGAVLRMAQACDVRFGLLHGTWRPYMCTADQAGAQAARGREGQCPHCTCLFSASHVVILRTGLPVHAGSCQQHH